MPMQQCRPQSGRLSYIDIPPCLAIITKRDNLVNSRPKTFFMLNSVKDESLNVHKYKNINEFDIFKLR